MIGSSFFACFEVVESLETGAWSRRVCWIGHQCIRASVCDASIWVCLHVWIPKLFETNVSGLCVWTKCCRVLSVVHRVVVGSRFRLYTVQRGPLRVLLYGEDDLVLTLMYISDFCFSGAISFSFTAVLVEVRNAVSLCVGCSVCLEGAWVALMRLRSWKHVHSSLGCHSLQACFILFVSSRLIVFSLALDC